MKKILLLSNDFMSLNFRKELKEGHEVYVSMLEAEENQPYEEMGCRVIPAPIDRRGINPLKDFRLYRHYRQIIRQIRPDIIFSYTIKPNIYGSLASRAFGCPQICNITGTGGVFLKKSLISELCKVLYRLSVKRAYKVFFQNADDKEFFLANSLVKDNYTVIPGSGCNLREHFYVRMPKTERIRFLNRAMNGAGGGTAEDKLRRFLLSHADAAGRVTLPCSLSGLSARLDIGRSSLYRALEELSSIGFLRRDGKEITIQGGQQS